MSTINVNTKNLKKEVSDWKHIEKVLINSYSDLSKVKGSSVFNASSFSSVKKSLQIVEDDLEKKKISAKEIKEALDEVIELYVKAERKITNTDIDRDKLGNPKGIAGGVDTEFVFYASLFVATLLTRPYDLGTLKDLLWKAWATETGNEIEKELFSAIDGFVSKYLAFEYVEDGDYYVTNENYGIQRTHGFLDVYDYLGPLLGMDLDTEILVFTPEGSDKEYRLQLWKGSYGWDGAYGGEIGLYSRSAEDAANNPYSDDNPNKEMIYYDCVSGEDEIETTQQIYSKDGELLFSNSTGDYADDGDHFWNLAIKTDPGYDKDDLVTVSYITVEDEAMREAIIEACEGRDDITYRADQSTDDVIVIQYGEFE